MNVEIIILGGLLQTAQSYPSLSANNTTNNSCSITTIANRTFCVGEALTMSLASTSSDSEQVSLEVSVCILYHGLFYLLIFCLL